MRISDWSSDVCSAGLDDALDVARRGHRGDELADDRARDRRVAVGEMESIRTAGRTVAGGGVPHHLGIRAIEPHAVESRQPDTPRSEEHTSELQSLMRISYAVFCLKKKTKNPHQHN